MTAALDRLTAALGAAHVLTSPDDVAHASLDGRGRMFLRNNDRFL